MLTVTTQKVSSRLTPITFLSAQNVFPSLTTRVREAKEGDDVVLDCVTNGYPTPVLSWDFVELGKHNIKCFKKFALYVYSLLRAYLPVPLLLLIN